MDDFRDASVMAEPGPWVVDESMGYVLVLSARGKIVVDYSMAEDQTWARDNAGFICAAVNHLRAELYVLSIP